MKAYNGFTPAQRTRALAWLKGEYAAGRRTPPASCDVCGQDAGIVEAHSEDYSEPFGDHIGYHGLCYVCHMMVHCRFRAPAAFIAYREFVAGGGKCVAFRSRNFGDFTVLLRQFETRPAGHRDNLLDALGIPGGTP